MDEKTGECVQLPVPVLAAVSLRHYREFYLKE